MKIARVFPRRTNATPSDPLAFVGLPPKSFPEVDEIHISVAFTYDLTKVEKLEKAWWEAGVPVKIGGPATGEKGGEFTPGMYLQQGYTITSRGCNNKCWFCEVWKREGPLQELPIKSGWNILDDNFLSCSDDHIKKVFEMLDQQPNKPLFTGGLEARLLKPWHVELFRKAKTERLYFAYDTPDDFEPLVAAGELLRAGGITQKSHRAACYVLIGYPGDTFEKAERRLTDTVLAGFWPNAMLFRDYNGKTEKAWEQFQREWFAPQIVGVKIRNILQAKEME